MSLYGALFSGVSGLASQSSAMGAISDNITNVNTTGYKGAQVNFQTLVTKQTSITQYSPGGVQSKPRNGIDVQGLLQSTSSSTDIALSGQGMFVVNTAPDSATSGTGMFAYTRAGSFKTDNQGYLTNVSGFYLQGWPLAATDNSSSARPSETVIDGNTYMKAYKDTTGNYHYINQNTINPTEMKSLNLKTIGGTADPTTQIKMGANLPSGDGIFNPGVAGSGGLHESSALIYDSLGGSSSLNVSWMKTNANQWDIANKTNYFGVNMALTDTTASPDSTATFSIAGQATGGSATVASMTSYAGGHTAGFFASTGVIAFQAAADAATLPLGTQFTVAGSEDSANNGTFLVKTAATTSAGADTLITASQAVSVVRNGTTTTYSSVTSTGATNITFGGATTPTLVAGDIIKVTNAAGTVGYYQVTNVGAAGSTTVSALDYVAVDTAPYQTLRGIKPPAGAAVLDIYDPSGTSGAIYASQGRLDFTASSRTDITALDGKTFSITPTGSSVALTVEFDTNGTNDLYKVVSNPTGASNIIIDLSTTSLTSGSDIAQLVAKALNNAANWDATTNTHLPTTSVSTSTGSTLPLFRANGGTLEIVQQTSVADSYLFDVSALGTGCTQSQSHQWNSSIPSVDQVTGKFTLQHISSAVASTPAIKYNGDGTPQTIMGYGSTSGSSATAPTPKISIEWANGAQSMMEVPNGSGADHRINWFLGNTAQADGMTQLGGNFQLSYLTQNGAKFGNFSGVSVGSDGVVTALFDNGVRRPVFQIPVATFTNVNGMESLTGNSWIETNSSGTYTLREANKAGAGSIASASLEASTVDIGAEFTTMIVTQRAYSAAAKIITTADQMLDELVQIKR
ncbi:flagellar biosynthesis protein FlgE [Paramagnetospirillum kuznetsovii]|uniref:Flagellar hook protein FlgE n=1 Tax=Paramagnetospirillum kuznetsovii TaxID=2053833 RepID=A0A364NX22_9PROT|nr:flagellar hook-basal body complex protein [Paramagnetospirillum kuznetsovii]RAU21634.1 flagellar biosynthesis protein FlgE [Paramagnetospirillum kuznetsovii]